MARELPSTKFSPRQMMETAIESSQRGNMRTQEAYQRITNDTLSDMFIAGFKHCMDVHEIVDDGPAGVMDEQELVNND